jgi:hypothetical protein
MESLASPRKSSGPALQLRVIQNDKHTAQPRWAVLFLGECLRFRLIQFNAGGEFLKVRRQSCNLLFLLREL